MAVSIGLSAGVSSACTVEPRFVDVRGQFATLTSGNPAKIATLPWSLGRVAIERATALMRDAYRPHVFRFDSKADDPLLFEASASSTHNEIQTLWAYFPPGHASASGPVSNGVEFWQAWSFLVEPGPVTTARWTILGQWHATEDNANTAPTRAADDALSPPFCLNLTSGDFLAVTTRTDANEQQLTNRFPVERFEYLSTQPLERGRWHNVVTNIKFDWSGSGKCRVWLNSQQIVSQVSGYSIGYNDAVGPHWNWGIYRGLYTTPGDVSTLVDANQFACQYANMEFSLGSLESRIGMPLPA